MKKRLLLVRYTGGMYRRYVLDAGEDIMPLVPNGTFYAFNDFRISQNFFLIFRAFKKELEAYAFQYIVKGSNGN